MPTLATISDLRLRRDIAVDDEAVYMAYLDTVEAQFESMTKRLWRYRENDVQFYRLDWENQRGAKRLYTRLFPINTTTAGAPCIEVKHWQTPDTEANATTLVLNTSYQLQADRGVITNTTMSKWFDTVKVTVSGGYASANAPVSVTNGWNVPPVTPPDIVEAICRQSIYMRLRTEGDRIVLQSQSSLQGQANVSFTYSDKPHDAFFLQVVKTYMRRTYGGYG